MCVCVRREREEGRAGGRRRTEDGRSGAALKTNTPHAKVGKKRTRKYDAAGTQALTFRPGEWAFKKLPL